MWSYHKETRRFSLGGVGLGIFICSTSFSPGDQKNFSWWGGADDFSKLNSSTLPRENLFVSWSLDVLFCVQCSCCFDWKSMKSLFKIFLMIWLEIYEHFFLKSINFIERSYHQETRRFSLGGVRLGIFICCSMQLMIRL